MRTRLFFLAACSGLLLANGARLNAQTTTNADCWTYSSGSVSCRSRTSPDLGTSIANVFAAYAEDQRIREARQRAEQLAASQRALTEALARDREYAARVDQERAQAQARLFWRRAEFVLSSVADSFALDLRGAERLNQAAVPLLADLLLAYPDASSEEIADNLLPVTMPIVRRSSALWEASQDWIDQNEQLISTLSSAEKSVLARGLIEGRTEAMSTQGSGAAILQRSAESAIQGIQRNRSACAQGDTSCEREWLPASLQRAHDVARESRARREAAATRVRTREVSAQVERRRRVVDSATAIIASRLARRPDGPQIRPALDNHLKSHVEGLTLDVALRPNALADASFSRLASADAACRELVRCNAGEASPDAVANFVRAVAVRDSAASVARAQSDTADARQTCEDRPLDCRLDLIPIGEHAAIELRANEARRFPARWRLPAGVSKVLAGPDTTISLSTVPYRQTWAATGGRAQLLRRTSVVDGSQVIDVNLRQELFDNSSFAARRDRVHFYARIHASTGAVLRQTFSSTRIVTDPIERLLIPREAPNCFIFAMPETRTELETRASERFGTSMLFLVASLLAPSGAPLAAVGVSHDGIPSRLEWNGTRYVVAFNNSVFGSAGRTAEGQMFYSYDATSSPWLQQQQDLWEDPWAADPEFVCRAR